MRRIIGIRESGALLLTVKIGTKIVTNHVILEVFFSCFWNNGPVKESNLKCLGSLGPTMSSKWVNQGAHSVVLRRLPIHQLCECRTTHAISI